MRGLMNHVVNEGFVQHDNWNRFAVTRKMDKYVNGKYDTFTETYNEGILPYQEDVLKIVHSVSNPHSGGAYDGYQIRDNVKRDAFARDELRYWIFYVKKLSDQRQVEVMIQHENQYTSSEVSRFTRAVDEFIHQAEGEQRQNWRR